MALRSAARRLLVRKPFLSQPFHGPRIGPRLLLCYYIPLRGGKEEAEEGDLDGEARLIAMYHGVVAGRLLQRCARSVRRG